MEILRVLVLSGTPWNRSNSFGSTYATIFDGFKDLHVSNLYTAAGIPDAESVDEAFQVTEIDLLRAVGRLAKGAGHRVEPAPTQSPPSPSQGDQLLTRISAPFRGRRVMGKGLAIQVRKFIWLIAPRHRSKADAFIRESNPDLIFLPLYPSGHINRMALHAKKLTGAPMVAYVSDDIYSLRQFSLSPAYWFHKVLLRRHLRKVIGECDWLYVVSEPQRVEYERTLGIECRLLTKLGDFSGEMPDRKTDQPCDDVVFTYAGNIGNSRWKTLKEIGDAISASKRQGFSAHLDIYTMTPVRGEIRRALGAHDSIRVHSAVPAQQLNDIYANSHVLVLAEPTSLRGRLAVRHSLSTKVVEYAETGRAILARGGRGTASSQHLQQAGAALASFPGDDLEKQVMDLVSNPELRDRLAHNAWEMGKNYHDQRSGSARVEADLRRAAGLT